MSHIRQKRLDSRLALCAVGGLLRGRRGGVSVAMYRKCDLVVAGYLRIPSCVCVVVALGIVVEMDDLHYAVRGW